MSVASTKLTLARVAAIARQDVRELRTLEAPGQGITDTDDLSVCVELKKVNLAKNALKNLDGLMYCSGLTFLNVSENQVETLSPLSRMVQLSVLNASNNSLTHVEGVARLAKLKALILNHNKLKRIPHFGRLAELNTLVVSSNEIEDLSPVRALKSLTKLSASHCGVVVIPDVADLHELAELRLNDNKIVSLPESLQFNYNLKTLELGNNRICKYSDIEVLGKMANLKQLTLKGNPVANEPDYKTKLADLIPSLEVLDGVRFRGRKLHRMLYQKEKASGGKAAKAKGRQGAGQAQDAAPTTDSAESGKAEHTHDAESGPPQAETQQLTAPQPSKKKPVKAKGADQPHEGVAAQAKLAVGGAGKPKTKQPGGSHSGKNSKASSGADSTHHQTNVTAHTPGKGPHSTQHIKEQKRKPVTEAEEGRQTKKQKREGDSAGKKGEHKKGSAAGTKNSAIPSGSGGESVGGAVPEKRDAPARPATGGNTGVVKVDTKLHTPKVEDVSSLFGAVTDAGVGAGGDSAWD